MPSHPLCVLLVCIRLQLEANFFETSDCKYNKLFEAGFDELLMVSLLVAMR